MASVPNAAKDPIFMMHHANIDRVLQAWQGANPTVWFAAGNSGGNFYYPPNSWMTGSSFLAPFRVNTGSLVSNNFTRTMHNNIFLSNRYSYSHLNITGARRLGRRLQQGGDITVERSNRLLASQVLAEMTQLQEPESFRLQYKLPAMDVNQFGGRPFCLSFVYGSRDELIKKYESPPGSNRVRLLGARGMQEDARYCGAHCLFRGGDMTTTPVELEDVVVDLTSCLLKLNIKIPSGDKPYTYPGPNIIGNPVIRLSNFSMIATYVNLTTATRTTDDPNGGVVEVIPSLKLPPVQQLCWWKLLVGYVTEPVTVVSDRRSMVAQMPTVFVNATSAEGVELPGAVAGVVDMVTQL
eukprot:gene5293-5528_t